MTCTRCSCSQARVRIRHSYDAIYHLDRETMTATIRYELPWEVPAMPPYQGLHGEIQDGVLVIMESGPHDGERYALVAKAQVA